MKFQKRMKLKEQLKQVGNDMGRREAAFFAAQKTLGKINLK